MLGTTLSFTSGLPINESPQDLVTPGLLSLLAPHVWLLQDPLHHAMKDGIHVRLVLG